MFTGIVTAIGTIREASQRGDLRAVIACPWDPAGITIGASIACSGTCLTVVERGGSAGDAWFAVDISGESVARTAPERWTVGTALNLEPALRLGDELGGHIGQMAAAASAGLFGGAKSKARRASGLQAETGR